MFAIESKIIRHILKKENVIHSHEPQQKALKKITSEMAQMLELVDKDFEATITNKFEELKENMAWRSKQRFFKNQQKILDLKSWRNHTT